MFKPRRPPFFPKQDLVGVLKLGRKHRREGDVNLRNFYNAYKEKAELTPYSLIPDTLSRKLAEQLTHPTPSLYDDRWQGVVKRIGQACGANWPQCSLAGWQLGDGPAFYNFLKKEFVIKEGSTLWVVIWALWIQICTDVLEEIQDDISEFFSTPTPGVAEPRCGPDSLDSGVGSLGSVESCQNVREDALTSTNPPEQNPPQVDNCLLFKQPDLYFMRKNENGVSTCDSILERAVEIPKLDIDPKSHPEYNDIDPDNDKTLIWKEESEIFKEKKAIKLLVLHTQDERDEQAAEDFKRDLSQIRKFHFETYLLKDLYYLLDLDRDQHIMDIYEQVDFVVPALTNTYLRHIKGVGNADLMPTERLLLRYINMVAQHRVINKNSLNYLIRPILVGDVDKSIVRKRPEFHCAVQYPKDLERFADNLHKTKQLLSSINFSR